nr:hypothetical protein Iba_chr12aCG12640 [Ipomoea batatas]
MAYVRTSVVQRWPCRPTRCIFKGFTCACWDWFEGASLSLFAACLVFSRLLLTKEEGRRR